MVHGGGNRSEVGDVRETRRILGIGVSAKTFCPQVFTYLLAVFTLRRILFAALAIKELRRDFEGCNGFGS